MRHSLVQVRLVTTYWLVFALDLTQRGEYGARSRATSRPGHEDGACTIESAYKRNAKLPIDACNGFNDVTRLAEKPRDGANCK